MHSPSDTTTDGNSLQCDTDRNKSNNRVPVITEKNYRTLQRFKFVWQMKPIVRSRTKATEFMANETLYSV